MAHLLIIDLPGGNDTDILQAACEAGHTFSFLTSDLSLYGSQAAVAPWIHRAQRQIEVADFQPESVLRAVEAVHRQEPFEGLLCLIDIRLKVAAFLAARLGLHYLNEPAAKLLRDKYEVRRMLQSQGLAQPDFRLATDTESIKAAVRDLGLPVLIKPADGYGSQNIVVLRTEQDLLPAVSPLEIMLPSRADYGLGVMANDRLLVERYMQGTLIGCDVFTDRGRHHLLGVNEKVMFAPPSFAIRGSSFTPARPEHAALEQTLAGWLDAVGFDCGATHIEVMLTAEGPRLVEINPRLVGAKIGRQVSLALGRSIYRDLIDLHLGRWTPPDRTRGQVATTRWFVAPQVGFLAATELPSWRNDPRIKLIDILKQPGEAVTPPFENAHRLGYVIVCADSSAESAALAERLVEETVVRIHTSAQDDASRWQNDSVPVLIA